MHLPSCLTQHPDGSIRVSGHRICLEHLMEFVARGTSAANIQQQFPTLPLPLIDQVLAFCAENRAEVDAYAVQCRTASEQLCRATPKKFTLEQLRTRFAEAQKASAAEPSA